MYEKEIEAQTKKVANYLELLQIEMEKLAAWKCQAALQFLETQSNSKPAPVQEQTAKMTKTVLFKKTGYTVTTEKRRRHFCIKLKIYIKKEDLSYEVVKKHVGIFGQNFKTFGWCNKLSDTTIFNLYKYCRDNY